MRMPVRTASESDFPEVVNLLNSAYRGKSGVRGWTSEEGIVAGDRMSAETLREELAAKPHATLLVYEQQETLFGCVWVEPVDCEVWYLGSLAIQPALQNHNHGRRLLDAAEQWIAARLGRTVKMTVIEDRRTLLEWYERRGYQRTGHREPFPLTDTRFGTPLKPDLMFEVLTKNLVP